MIRPIAALLSLVAPAHAKAPAVLLEPKRAFELVAEHRKDPAFVILDVRTPEEYAEGRLAGGVLLDFHGKDFRERLEGLDKTKTYLVHCAAGVRSRKTASLMSKLGFEKVYDMKGGFRLWVDEGLPWVK